MYIERLVKLIPNWKDYQVGVLALDYSGKVGASSVVKGFNFAVGDSTGNKLLDAKPLQ